MKQERCTTGWLNDADWQASHEPPTNRAREQWCKMSTFKIKRYADERMNEVIRLNAPDGKWAAYSGMSGYLRTDDGITVQLFDTALDAARALDPSAEIEDPAARITELELEHVDAMDKGTDYMMHTWELNKRVEELEALIKPFDGWHETGAARKIIAEAERIKARKEGA